MPCRNVCKHARRVVLPCLLCVLAWSSLKYSSLFDTLRYFTFPKLSRRTQTLVPARGVKARFKAVRGSGGAAGMVGETGEYLLISV